MKNNMISRRDVISGSATAAVAYLGAPLFANTASGSTLVNDMHSQLNPTPVNRILNRNLPSSWLTFCCPLHTRGAQLAWP